MICRDNRRRARLDELARGRMREQGTLGESVVIAGREWGVGDRVIAREPTEIFLIDEPSTREQGRREIAPPLEQPQRDALEVLAWRMRERDDEDLAFEQLERGGHELEWREEPAGVSRSGRYAAEPGVSAKRERLDEFDEHPQLINEQLRDPAIEDARAISRLRATIDAVEREHERDRKPLGWRDRAGHHTRNRQRERQLAELHEQQRRLLERTPEPEATIKRAQRLRERQRTLGAERLALREQAIGEELATRPPWLDATLGTEPRDGQLRERWAKAAREIAGHRIDHRITDPHIAFSEQAGDHALHRSITDTRAALGLDGPARERDFGLGH